MNTDTFLDGSPRPRSIHRWTEDEYSSLKSLIDAGHSPSEIATRMSQTRNERVTKNAVIGAAHRRGWSWKRRKSSI